MTDKRSESERVSARPPLPSLAPPTDDIDSEWGADDDVPAAPPAAKLSVPAPSVPASASPPSAPPANAANSTPVPSVRPSSPPRPMSSAPPVARIPTPVPRASATPVPRASSAPPQATSTPPQATSPAPTANNPLRKQTLLGIAPVIPERAERAEPPVATETVAPKPPLTVEPSNPLRKQTLLGIAPVQPSALRAPERTPTAAETPSAKSDAPSAESNEPNANADLAPSVPSLPTPPRPVATDAPVMSDTTADSAVSSLDADVAALQPKRSRWLLPLVAAAAIGLGVVGLRRLDTPPVVAVPAPPAAAVAAKPAPQPEPEKPSEASAATPPLAEPPAAPAAAAIADAKPAEAQPAPSASAEATAPASGDVRRIAVTSDPPGARLFWRGKEVGTTPFTLELQPNEKHAYELGLPGYVTRKVVIDGSKSEINIGMRPQAGPFTGATPRK